MCIDLLDPKNAKKNKNAFELPAKTRVSKVSNITVLDPSNSWHQDLEFDPRMNIFGSLEPKIWLFEVL